MALALGGGAVGGTLESISTILRALLDNRVLVFLNGVSGFFFEACSGAAQCKHRTDDAGPKSQPQYIQSAIGR